MDTEPLESLMTRMGDALSYPYWATQDVLWNGKKVLVQSPSLDYGRKPITPAVDTGD
jgi:hypothetical protein